MRIGIITMIGYNYGNRLQNVALSELLKEMGHETVSGLDCYCKQDWELRSKSKSERIIKKLIPYHLYNQYIKKITSPEKDEITILRERNFDKFNTKYLKLFPKLCVKKISDIAQNIDESEYDYFIVGSDQVWNPYFEGHTFEFLLFTDPKKRLAFSASIGVDEIPAYAKQFYAESLKAFNWISVREESAKNIIYELTKQKVDVVFDPTLILKKEKWDKLAKKPKYELPEKYICTYFLGETPQAVGNYAKEKGLPLMQMNSRSNPQLYVIDPAEFLYVIKHAAVVLTDSFHAFAFSLKFNKEFYVFNRKQEGVKNMFSRIGDIITLFDLNKRIQEGDRIIEDKEINIDKWNEINCFFESERIKTIKVLKKAFPEVKKR